MVLVGGQSELGTAVVGQDGPLVTPRSVLNGMEGNFGTGTSGQKTVLSLLNGIKVEGNLVGDGSVGLEQHHCLLFIINK